MPYNGDNHPGPFLFVRNHPLAIQCNITYLYTDNLNQTYEKTESDLHFAILC